MNNFVCKIYVDVLFEFFRVMFSFIDHRFEHGLIELEVLFSQSFQLSFHRSITCLVSYVAPTEIIHLILPRPYLLLKGT